jgi:AcrR family transcriptional regulator
VPRRVDHNQRRQDITDAAIRILGRGPSSNLTLQSIADELGGSIRLVTHFFAGRSDLFVAVVDDLIAGYDEELAAMEEGSDDRARLRILLEWMLPLSQKSRSQEAGRIALISLRDEQDSVDHFFLAMDKRHRALLKSHLAPLVDPERLSDYVDFLRAMVNGVVLSTVEHPKKWPRRRQLAVLDNALCGLDLGAGDDLGDEHRHESR